MSCDAMLAANEAKAARERLAMIRIFEELRALGYNGGHDAVCAVRRAPGGSGGVLQQWGAAFVLLTFAPSEAYPFDRSSRDRSAFGRHGDAQSRPFAALNAYPCETQEMAFDAHE